MSELITLEDVGLTANEMMVIVNAETVLNRHYPDHNWFVGINSGVLDIRPGHTDAIGGPLDKTMVYTIRYLDCFSSSDLDQRIKDAGGLWLEVLRLSRGPADYEKIAGLKTDFTGRHKLEL